jgi:hypothetical protein
MLGADRRASSRAQASAISRFWSATLKLEIQSPKECDRRSAGDVNVL